jgi:hypothetical protein
LFGATEKNYKTILSVTNATERRKNPNTVTSSAKIPEDYAIE